MPEAEGPSLKEMGLAETIVPPPVEPAAEPAKEVLPAKTAEEMTAEEIAELSPDELLEMAEDAAAVEEKRALTEGKPGEAGVFDVAAIREMIAEMPEEAAEGGEIRPGDKYTVFTEGKTSTAEVVRIEDDGNIVLKRDDGTEQALNQQTWDALKEMGWLVPKSIADTDEFRQISAAAAKSRLESIARGTTPPEALPAIPIVKEAEKTQEIKTQKSQGRMGKFFSGLFKRK